MEEYVQCCRVYRSVCGCPYIQFPFRKRGRLAHHDGLELRIVLAQHTVCREERPGARSRSIIENLKCFRFRFLVENDGVISVVSRPGRFAVDEKRVVENYRNLPEKNINRAPVLGLGLSVSIVYRIIQYRGRIFQQCFWSWDFKSSGRVLAQEKAGLVQCFQNIFRRPVSLRPDAESDAPGYGRFGGIVKDFLEFHIISF